MTNSLPVDSTLTPSSQADGSPAIAPASVGSTIAQGGPTATASATAMVGGALGNTYIDASFSSASSSSSPVRLTRPLPTTTTTSSGSTASDPGSSLQTYITRYGVEIAAGSSSMSSTFISYPLDSVKTRMQAYQFSSIRACVKQAYLSEGVHGFWRGVWSPLLSTAFVRTLSFSVYQQARQTYSTALGELSGDIGTASSISDSSIEPDRRLVPSVSELASISLAGCTAGVVSAVIACPFELSKLAAQISVLMARDGSVNSSLLSTASTSTSMSHLISERGVVGAAAPVVPSLTLGAQRSSWETVKWLVRTRGITSLYSGFRYHLLRDSVGTGVYFTTYETTKQFLSNVSRTGGDATTGGAAPSPGVTAIAGGLCGVMGWIVIYPIDSAKSIYQKNQLSEAGEKRRRPVIEYFNKNRYRGLSVSVGRSCIMNAIFFTMFERVKREIEVRGGHG